MFYSTEDAFRHGLEATHRQKLWLKRLRGEFGRQSQAALDRDRLNLAIYMATQAQLCREAYDCELIAGYMYEENKDHPPKQTTVQIWYKERDQHGKHRKINYDQSIQKRAIEERNNAKRVGG